jgi:hypothetical protein
VWVIVQPPNRLLNASDLTLIGLLVDVAGACVFASSIMSRTPAIAADESTNRSGGNNAVFRSAIFQRSEAWCGLTLLVFGFFLQVVGSYQNAATQSGVGVLNSAPMVGVVAVGVWFICYLLWLVFHLDAQERFLEHIFAGTSEEVWNQPVSAESAPRTARMWGVRRLPDETAEQLAERLTRVKLELGPRMADRADLHGTKTVAQMRDS